MSNITQYYWYEVINDILLQTQLKCASIRNTAKSKMKDNTIW